MTIRFKLATLTCKALHPGRLPYLADLLQYHKTTKSTRLSSTQPLSIPPHNFSFGSRAFRVSAPKVWNSLPFQISQSESLPTFKRHLKTQFSVSLCHYLGPRPPMRPDSVPDLGAIQIISLLTYLLTINVIWCVVVNVIVTFNILSVCITGAWLCLCVHFQSWYFICLWTCRDEWLTYMTMSSFPFCDSTG